MGPEHPLGPGLEEASLEMPTDQGLSAGDSHTTGEGSWAWVGGPFPSLSGTLLLFYVHIS